MYTNKTFVFKIVTLTFRGPGIVRIFQYISNKTQHCTVYFIRKLLYMFRVVPPPIIRSAYNSIYSIWYLSHRYCYPPLSCKSWNSTSNSSTITADSSNGVTNTRCRRYRCMRSWWWVQLSRKSWNSTLKLSSNSYTITADSSNGVTNTKYCRYSCMRSWWQVEVPKEKCRAVSRYNKLCNVASCWKYIGIKL
jgi:hypothetical protein